MQNLQQHLKNIVRVATCMCLVSLSLTTSAQTPRAVPTAYPVGTKVNYVRMWQVKSPQTDPNALVSRPLREVVQTTQYLDGLGRPLQTVVKQGSYPTNGTAVDMISMNEYDAFGREPFKYLPTAANNAGTNTSISDGAFKLNPFAQQAAFYANNTVNATNNNLSGIINNQGETFYYGETRFEASPLSRPLEGTAPGNSWTGTMWNTTETSRKGIKTKYYVNTATDNVRIWNVTPGVIGAFSTYASPAAYGAGQLFKNITVDENNKQVIEFKDKEGKVILKKVQLTATADDGTGKNHAGWLCTYYLYDDLDNLRCVIQPKGVEALNVDTWTVATSFTNATILAEQCFRYEYDQRNRMIIKKVPGATEAYMVYDTRDRLVMTQDGNLRAANTWLVTLYDNLNRPVQTGKLLNTYFGATPKTFTQHLSSATPTPLPASFSAYPFDVAATPAVTYWEYLTKTGYDDYTAIPAASALTNTYDATYNTYLTAGTASPDFADAAVTAATANTKGMVTWTETKVLNTTTYTYAVMLYDEKGRTVQVKSKNQTGGADVATTQYTWAGQPIITVTKQQKEVAPTQTSIVVTRLSYDDLGRPVKTEKRLQNTLVNGNVMSAYTTTATNEYNALGQLARKSLGSKKDPATGAYYGTRQQLAKQEYQYNIRGWMLSINKPYITNTTNSDQYFGMQLGYDKNGDLGTFTPQLNGNISGTIWKSEGDQQKRKYNFSYDAVNRLLKADFTQYVSGSGTAAVFNTTAGINFSMQMGDGVNATSAYDANGNILAMKQWGLQLTSSGVIDDMRYTYITNTNKLKSVTDFSNSPTTKLGDFKTNTTHAQYSTKSALTSASTQAQFDAITDYTYDTNGNLVRDYNKDIITFSGTDGILYNHLNLPMQITVKKDATTNKGIINYTYDAAGNKLKKVTVENPSTANGNKTITTTTNYINGFVYESKTTVPANTPNDDYTDVLQFMPQEEGRIRYVKTNAKLEFDYFLKDHLGNTRAVLTEEVTQNTYPAATLENVTFNGGTAISVENSYYNITPANVVAQTVATGIPAYQNNNGVTNNNPYSNTAANSASLYKLDATTNTVGNKTGLGIALKVMAGDKINLFAKSYHKMPATGYTALINPLTVSDIMNLFAGTSLAVAKGITGSAITSQSGFPTTMTGLLNNSAVQSNNTPKAGINWVILDDQFKWVDGGFDMVDPGNTSTGTLKSHVRTNIAIPKNGYIYIYCSNESQYQVFFDNLQVIHTPGPIMEETHYYPFGLVMTGISSKTAGALQNKNKFNGGNELQSAEFSDGSGLETYDATNRMYDPQLGRFFQIDPLADLSLSWSTYAFASDNPILRNDPLGLKDSVVTLQNVTVTSYTTKWKQFKNWFTGRDVQYNGSGWGHGPRRWMSNQIGLTGYANNLFELGLHSQLQSSQVTLGGDLLDKIKSDPAMVEFQNNIIKMLKADPRFKKQGFVLADKKVVEFGGKRAPGDMAEQIKDPFNPAYADTWKVAGNELTWAVRHATVTFTALAKADGVIVIGYKLNDSFDLSAQTGRSGAYNTVSEGAGFLYHNVAGGNSSLQVNAWWDATIK